MAQEMLPLWDLWGITMSRWIGYCWPSDPLFAKLLFDMILGMPNFGVSIVLSAFLRDSVADTAFQRGLYSAMHSQSKLLQCSAANKPENLVQVHLNLWVKCTLGMSELKHSCCFY